MSTQLPPRVAAGAGARRPDAELDEPERRLEKFLELAPFALLVISTIPYLLTQNPTLADVGRTVALEVATAAWVLWWVNLHRSWHTRPVLMSVYFAGFVVCCGLLVARSPWFGFFCWIGYMHAFRYLQGPLRYVGLILIAALSALAQLGGFRTPTAAGVVIWLVVTLLNATLVTTFIYLGQKAEDQNEARKKMLGEVAEANHKLEEMMAENTGLHAQLLTQAREAGVLEERQRMAREIHDTLAQGLTGIITQLEAVAAGRPGPGLGTPDQHRRPAGPGQPDRGAPIGPRGPAGGAGEHPAAGGGGRRGRAVVGRQRRHHERHHHRHRARPASRGRGHPAAGGPGGPGQRGQARQRVPGRDHPVLHG